MKTYSPSEICNIFQIAKTTLYRWEDEGKISSIPRKITGEREYTDEHIAEIAKIQLENLYRESSYASKSENKARMEQILRANSLIKALYLNDLTGIRELKEYPESLSKKTIRDLLLKAADLDPSDRMFEGILELVRLKV